MFRIDPNEKIELDGQNSIILNSTSTAPKRIIEIPTKPFVDSSHESSRSTREIASVLNDQNFEFDKSKLTNLDKKNS